MTLAEFLDWDDETDQGCELVDGWPVAMAPPLEAHGTVVGNLAREIGNLSKPPCRVVVGGGLAPADRADTCFIPDIRVTCAPPEVGQHLMAEPVLVAEVLSSTTESHDRGLELLDYRRIPSVREILLISAGDRHMER